MTDLDPPEGAREGGRRLWGELTTRWTFDEHEMVLLRRAVRVVDHCDALQAQVDAAGMLHGPEVTELRMQTIVLARLFAALRVPTGAPGDADVDEEGRLQRRGRPRGVYGLDSA
jgi:hypothetical protein